MKKLPRLVVRLGLLVGLSSIICSCAREKSVSYPFPLPAKPAEAMEFGAGPSDGEARSGAAKGDEDLFQEVVPGDGHAKSELIAITELHDREVPEHLEFGADPTKAWTPPRWRHAKCLLKLRERINQLAPNRKITDDGFVGNCAHCCKSIQASDHCPWVEDDVGIVTAYDITHCPNEGLDCNVLVNQLVESRDPRIKYIIWNWRIINCEAVKGVPAWTWRKYSGKNGHTKHCHISVLPQKNKYDSTASWNITRIKK